MRKIKKINGFLVVKFNDREKREYEGTALGEYGVIDAEVYTGNLDIDRGAMEYDDADTLEVAVELARGLESEEDITDEPPTYTAAVETNESYTEEAVEPAALIEGWTRRLATQVKSKHYPDTDPRTAAHELYGFKMALRQIGFLPESEVITDPDTFGAGRLDGPTNGQHQLRIEAVDGNFATSVRVFSFSKKETVIKFELVAPEETDAAATKVLVTPTWKIEGAVAKVEACNNGFDAVPTWEDITAMVQINRVYNFTNKTKTASKWGVNIRFTITKNEGFEGEVSISGFGGAYE